MSYLSELPNDLASQITSIITAQPQAGTVFEALYDHLTSSKKRKVATSVDTTQVVLEIADVSVISPIRKKLNFVIALSNNKPVVILSKTGGEPELVIEDLSTIKYAAFLPIPEKPKLEYLFISYGEQQLMLNLNKEALTKQLSEKASSQEFSGVVSYLQRQATMVGFTIANPFASKSAFFVEAYRGTKDGHLYFLPNQIIFGFKKPILVFASEDIESITYTSITRLTFNVTLVLKTEEKYEFSMIDQNEFSVIDEYVKAKDVVNKSMSDELKAKTKSTQQAGALQEAEELANSEPAVGFDDSDDEEADGNFVANTEVDDTSDVSDVGSGSEEESGDEDDEDNGTEVEEEVENDTEVEEVAGNDIVEGESSKNDPMSVEELPSDEHEMATEDESGTEYY